MNYSAVSTGIQPQSLLHGINSESMDYDSSTDSGELVDRLLGKLVESSFDTGKEFWPRGCIQEVITPMTIAEELNLRSSLVLYGAEKEDRTTLDALVDFIRDGSQKTFAIALCCNLGGDKLFQAMNHFKNLNFKDSQLPIVGEHVKHIFYSSTGRGYKIPWNSLSVRSFCSYQWSCLAPVFDDRNRKLALYSEEILPFTWASPSGSSGTFGEVHRLTIHAGHQQNGAQVKCSPAPISLARANICMVAGWKADVAIKKLHGTHSEDEDIQRKLQAGWDKEVRAHIKMTALKNPNIIEFVAAVTRGHERYLMFEWADGGNLREFWTRKPLLSRTLVRNVLFQLDGLAHALESMHSLNYRHGDMKPENILRVKTFGNNRPPMLDIGQLKICDMGLSKQHIMETRLREVATDT